MKMLFHLVTVFCLSQLLPTSGGIELPSRCGISTLHDTSAEHMRIVGGQVARKGFFPWAVFLNKTISYEGYEEFSDCGGSIINSRWVLTAAHCLQDVPDNLTELANEELGIQVRIDAIFGALNLNIAEKTQVRRNVTRVVRPNYNATRRSNDIALLELDRPLDLDGSDSHLMPICLNKQSVDNPGLAPTGSEKVNVSECYVAGFGFEDQQHEVNDFILHYLKQGLTTHRDCDRAFDDYNPEYNLCTGGEGKKGTCKGDSGSPFICKDKGKWTQVGLVSHGIPCAIPFFPDVLTDVGHFYKWIVEQK